MQLPVRRVLNESKIALVHTESWVMKSDGSSGGGPGTRLFMCLFRFGFELEMVKHTNQEEVKVYFQSENK